MFKNLLIKFVESSLWEESGHFLHRLSKFFGQAGFACIPPLFALHLQKVQSFRIFEMLSYEFAGSLPGLEDRHRKLWAQEAKGLAITFCYQGNAACLK